MERETGSITGKRVVAGPTDASTLFYTLSGHKMLKVKINEYVDFTILAHYP